VATLHAASDARQLTSELRAASVDQDRSVRLAATRLLGRLEHEAVIPMLELALADGDRGIRLDAARGLARHPAQPPALREVQLLGAYAAADDSIERAELVGLLADIALDASSPAFGQALRATESDERVAGCLAVQRLASRGRVPEPAQLQRVVELLGDESASVARACAAALSEPVARETLPVAERAHALGSLEALAKARDAQSALMAVPALAAIAGRDAVPMLEVLAGSSEPRIALESARALRRIAPPASLAALAERELQRPARESGQGARTDILLELIGALEQKPEHADALSFADRALRRLEPVVAGSSPRVGLERGLLHCAVARLADAARHWPKELFTCGHGRIPEAVRDAWIADSFAAVEDSHELRAVQLGRLFAKGPTQVRIAVLRGTATLPVKLAAAQLKVALADQDPRVLAAATAAIASRPVLREAEEGSRLTAADLLACADRVAHAPEAAASWLRAARVLGRGAPAQPIKSAPGSTEHAGNGSAEDSEAHAIQRLSSPPAALIERVTQLARHAARAIREPARALLSEWEAPLPTEIDPVAQPLPADRLPAAGAVFHVKLRTTAGEIELELDAEHVPVSAVRFVELARNGALDGLPVADRSAGHAVGFALAPSADRPALRHEDTYGAVERGSVLLQDHGRDAAGPGFALILARAPGLDRRAVQLGKISRGLEIADALTPADAILEAQVSIER
jgi:cyclophilin family peptidyl-prolyl cis-trans isomerase